MDNHARAQSDAFHVFFPGVNPIRLKNLSIAVRMVFMPRGLGGKASMKSMNTAWNGIAGDLIDWSCPWDECRLVCPSLHILQNLIYLRSFLLACLM